MLCNGGTGNKSLDIGYSLIMQFSPSSNGCANNQPQENHFISYTITHHHGSNCYYCPAY